MIFLYSIGLSDRSDKAKSLNPSVNRLLSESSLVTLMPIRDMDRALKFYTGALGGKLEMRGEGDMKNSWASVRVAGCDLWLIVPEKPEKRTLSYSAFVVKDIKTTVAEMRRRGVKFTRAERENKQTRVDGPIAHNEWGASAFFKDSEGNLLMLWQNP